MKQIEEGFVTVSPSMHHDFLHAGAPPHTAGTLSICFATESATVHLAINEHAVTSTSPVTDIFCNTHTDTYILYHCQYHLRPAHILSVLYSLTSFLISTIR